MDPDTLFFASLVYSKTQILQKEVFLMCTLEDLPQEQLNHLRAIVFCRCTKKNIDLIAADISGTPKFSQYNICKSFIVLILIYILNMVNILVFTNKVEPDMLQRLAEIDNNNVINSVQEVYLDFQAINPTLFSLDMPNVVPICRKSVREWSEGDHAMFSRMTDGVFSMLMSVRAMNTKIRYDEGSKICQMLA